MRIISNIEEFGAMGEFRGAEVIVLGAGKDGKAVAQKLCSKGVRVIGFIDDSMEKWGRQYHGVPVFSPNKVGETVGKVGLIAIGAFTWMSEGEIMQSHLVQSSGFSSANLVLFDKSRFLVETVRQRLLERQIDIEADVLEMGDLQIPNYLKMGQDIAKTFVVEAADLLLPHYYNDWSLVDEGPYEDEEIMSPGGRPPLVLDCGANLGLFSAIAASKGAEVYAFEPIKQSRDVLCKVVDIYPNIKIFPFALSDFSGPVTMSNSGNLGQNKIVHENLDEGVSVTCKTLDEFVHEEKLTHIDFLKADIEGAERDMLRGAKGVLRDFAPKLSLCTYHLDDDPEVLETIIKESNPEYRVIQKEKKLFAYVNK